MWLRQMFTISQTEDRLRAMLRLQEGDGHLGCWHPDLANARSARRSAPHSAVGVVNEAGTFEVTSACFLRGIYHNRCSTVPVHADGAGGWAMF
jgi:hypothetical protein